MKKYSNVTALNSATSATSGNFHYNLPICSLSASVELKLSVMLTIFMMH